VPSIKVKGRGYENRYDGDPRLHQLFTGTYYISIPDPTSPSGRSVIWQQGIYDGRTEAVEITTEGFDYDPFEAAAFRPESSGGVE
jgi:hypothetical protein